MKVEKLLREEHKKLKIFNLYLNAAADKIERGEPVAPRFFKKLAKFADLFIERYHLKIEEGLLLAFLIKKGFPEEEGIIRMLKRDHKEAARYLTDLWAAVAVWERDLTASKQIILNIRAYSRLITAHEGQEELILLPLLRSVLTPEEDEQLYTEAKQMVAEFNADLYQCYQSSINELQAELGVDAVREQEQLERLWRLMREGPEALVGQLDLFC
ncbi:MAG: hypothetical protein GX050_09500 [Firmicutes bacterium]|nr:hypothetical protein [Bacillota bacterium]